MIVEHELFIFQRYMHRIGTRTFQWCRLVCLPLGLEHPVPCTSPMGPQYPFQQPSLQPNSCMHSQKPQKLCFLAHIHSQSAQKYINNTISFLLFIFLIYQI